ncbi:hypothetical protein GWO18_01195, partial [Candidatus Bathyarchaeota archaeon]|nr:hypothetical protein [Candidatus Bathyarchaeota archaeon]
EFYHATVIADAGKARQYKLLTASDDFYTGKSRIFKDVQNSLIDPDFNKIIKMIP